MSLPSHEAARTWPGLTMVDRDGDTVGKITHIYLDRDSSQPEWALVAVPERGRVFVPLSGAGMQDDRVRVAVAAAAVRDAPEVASGRELSEPDEARLYSHYGATAGQPDRGAMRAPSAGGRAKDAANRLNQRAGGAANRLQEAGGRARGVVTSPPAKRLLSAAGAASALGAAAAVVGRSRRPRRGGMAGMLDGLLAAPGAALQRRRRRRRVQAAGRLLGGAATAPLHALRRGRPAGAGTTTTTLTQAEVEDGRQVQVGGRSGRRVRPRRPGGTGTLRAAGRDGAPGRRPARGAAADRQGPDRRWRRHGQGGQRRR